MTSSTNGRNVVTACFLVILWTVYYCVRTEILDYCLNESFNVTCEGGSVILVTSAKFGRMRPGRCISGDFNVGCSKDIKPFLDGQCSARTSCDVSVRSLVDLHPCQRDFVSYLEASYACIEVSGLDDAVCPEDGLARPQRLEGYLARSARSINSLGTEDCPWEVNVMKGQRINVTLMTQDLNGPFDDDAMTCVSNVIIDDLIASRRLHLHVCSGGKRRERHLATSAGHRIRVYVTDDVTNGERVILLHYSAVGCPEVRLPLNAYVQRIGEEGDNVMVRCNDSMETWYLACQSNRWLGDVGNCSRKAVQFVYEESKDEKPYSFNGVVMAVMIGVILGIIIGMILLLVLHCLRRRSLVQTKRSLGARSLLSTPQKEMGDELQPINFQHRSRDHVSRQPTETSDYSRFLTDVEMRLEAEEESGRCSCHRQDQDDYGFCPFRSVFVTSEEESPPHPHPHPHPIPSLPVAVDGYSIRRVIAKIPGSPGRPRTTSSKDDDVDLLRMTDPSGLDVVDLNSTTKRPLEVG